MVSGEYKYHFADYQQSDVEAVYERGEWNSWEEIIHWLRTEGMNDGRFLPREVAHMIADFTTLAIERRPFLDNPADAFGAAKSLCRHQGGQTWERRVS